MTQPKDLKDRAQQAGEALSRYQETLKIIDAKLSEPISPEVKTRLAKDQEETSTVPNIVRELMSSQEPAVIAALKEFQDARKAEVLAGLDIDNNCPHDIE